MQKNWGKTAVRGADEYGSYTKLIILVQIIKIYNLQIFGQYIFSKLKAIAQ